MKKIILICLSIAMSIFINHLFAQQTASIKYTHTIDGVQGILLEYEDLVTDHLFLTYGIGARKYQFPRWEYLTTFDVGYRLFFSNYQPDLRIGVGYIRGYQNVNDLNPDKPDSYLAGDDLQLTTSVKLRWLNWDFYERFQLPFRWTASVGLQYQFPMNSGYNYQNRNRWETTFETGIGYRF